MRKGIALLGLAVAVATAALAALLVGHGPSSASASSHREAPLIAADPMADNHRPLRVRQPGRANTVTIIANYIPLEEPGGGPNFYKFGDDVLYEIKIDNNGDAQGRRQLPVPLQDRRPQPEHVPLQHRPDHSLTIPNLNVRQFYSVTRIEGRHARPGARPEPADAAGQHRPALDAQLRRAWPPRRSRRSAAAASSSPASATTRSSSTSARSSTWAACARSTPAPDPATDTAGMDGVAGYNTHSIIMQVPITDLTRDHQMPPSQSDPRAVIGI